MATTNTTLNGAITAEQTGIRLASASAVVVGDIVRIDSEKMKVYDNSLRANGFIRVQRGFDGTLARAHGTLARTVFGQPADFPITSPYPQQDGQSNQPQTYSYGAAGALEVESGYHMLKAGAAVAMTLRAPTAAEEGTEMIIQAADAFAYTVTQTTPGFNSGGAAADVGTFGGAIGDNLHIKAENGAWLVITLRNVTLA